MRWDPVGWAQWEHSSDKVQTWDKHQMAPRKVYSQDQVAIRRMYVVPIPRGRDQTRYRSVSHTERRGSPWGGVRSRWVRFDFG